MSSTYICGHALRACGCTLDISYHTLRFAHLCARRARRKVECRGRRLERCIVIVSSPWAWGAASFGFARTDSSYDCPLGRQAAVDGELAVRLDMSRHSRRIRLLGEVTGGKKQPKSFFSPSSPATVAGLGQGWQTLLGVWMEDQHAVRQRLRRLLSEGRTELAPNSRTWVGWGGWGELIFVVRAGISNRLRANSNPSMVCT